MRFLLVAALAMFATTARAATPTPAGSGDVTGTVSDSGSGSPLQGVEVTVQVGDRVVANAATDPFGHYRMHNIPAGTYTIAAHFIGFHAVARTAVVPSNGTAVLNLRLVSAPAELQQVEVTGKPAVAVDTRTGDQVYTQNDAHSTPTYTTSQILQQSIVGAARAPTGEVHIDGQHAEYTYYIDGVPVPSGISGSLNELFDPEVVQRIDFTTGGWDAEYGGKNSAIINIQTKVPSGAFHADESTYYGSFNAMGQSLNLSANQGKWGEFISGAAQGTDMRVEPVESDKYNHPINFSNHGDDYFGFGKVQYTASPHDIFSLDGNYSMSYFQIPYDSALGVVLHDHETDVNDFINFAYRHKFGDQTASDEGIPHELFIGPYFRGGSLEYRPGSTDQPGFIDENDPTQTKRNVFEDRKFNSVGIKTDYGFPLIDGVVDGKVGVLTSYTYGHENFELIDPTGVQPNIASNSNLNGYDFSAYAETSIRPWEWLEFRPGVRYDSHVAPFAGNQNQWSPRLRLNFYPDASNTLFVYFARLFIPTNIEDLRSITLASGGGSTTASPTLPERDSWYEAGYVHRFPVGVITSFDAFYKSSNPGIDDNTIPGSAISTSVNLGQVKITGIKSAITVAPPKSPLSGYLNVSLIHAYGEPPITGGFFALEQPNYAFDLDHDQRLSAVANLLYTHKQFYVSTTGTYGSGLTNGLTPDATVPNGTGSVENGTYQPGYKSYCTGLLCFNDQFKVHPSYIQQLALGYTLLLDRTYVKPEFFMDNMWAAKYILKGAFFSGPSVGRPQSYTIKLSVGI